MNNMVIKTCQEGNGWKASFEGECFENVYGVGATPEKATENLIEVSLRVAKEILTAIKPEQEYAEKMLSNVKEFVTESHNSYYSDIAEIKFNKGSVRYSYDAKKLNEYAEEHKEILEWRKTSEVKPYAAVKWL